MIGWKVPRHKYDCKFVAYECDAQMSNGRNIPMYNNKNYHPEAQRAESEMVLVTTKHRRYHMETATMDLYRMICKRLAGRQAYGEV